MRKLISLGLLAIVLSLVASPVFAGNEPLCELLKDGASKGLYGLCIAYHNADSARAQERIWENYKRKAGKEDPPMPGTGDERKTATCPCLEDPNVVSIEDWGISIYCLNFGDGTDQGLFLNEDILNLTTWFTMTLSSDGVVHMCDITQSPATQVMLPIDANEYDECLSQLYMNCP